MVSDEVIASFNERASKYDLSALHRWLAQAVGDFIDFPVGDVLDVATGTGLALREVAGRAASLTGVDVAESMLQVARQALPGAMFVCGRAEALPFEPTSFDTILCVSALPYLDVPAAYREWSRACRPHGRVVITAVRGDGITSSRLFRQAARERGVTLVDPNAVTGFEAALTLLARDAGFVLETVSDVMYHERVPDPDGSFDTQLRYGFGNAVVEAGLQGGVRTRYSELLGECEVEEHRIMVARVRKVA